MPGGPAEVVIIGGGVAGLAAADVLSAAGKSVLVIEGRDRLGGRIDTRRDPAWPLPIERGAEFLHGKPPETWTIVRESGCCLYDLLNAHCVYRHGRVSEVKGFFEQVEKVMALVAKATRGNRDMSFAECLERFARRHKPEARQWARMYVEGFNAADATQVSCAWLKAADKAQEKIEGDRLFRVHAGYDRVVQFLRTALDDAARVECSALVHRIDWGVAGVVVHATGAAGEPRQFEARRALVTVPLGVLQAAEGTPGAIAFSPALPAEKQEAIGRLRMGAVVKVVLRFREAFWEKRFPELDFLHAPGQAFPTWWTTLPMRTAMLTGWAGGPAAEALSGRGEAGILAAAVGCLSRMLKISRRSLNDQLAGAHVCDWKIDPLARGAYSYAAVGGAQAARQLAAPVEQRLFFAGEATHTGMSGTVDGAIASGRRAAQEILG